MPNNTSRLGLVEPVGTDTVSELRLAIAANAAALDTVLLVTEGTLASRPSNPAPGSAYWATDTYKWYLYPGNGTSWIPLQSVGAWVSLTSFTGGWIPGPSGARYRIDGDLVRLSGSVQNQSGSTYYGSGLTSTGVVPSPPTTQQLTAYAYSSGSVTAAGINVSALGQLSQTGVITNSGSISFDGLVYPLS